MSTELLPPQIKTMEMDHDDVESRTLLSSKLPPPSSSSSRLLLLATYILIWYAASILCNTSVKKLLFSFAPLPLWVTLFQFITATFMLHFYLRLVSKPTSTMPLPNQRAIFHRLVLAYTLGFVFVNAGYLAVTVSLAETLRSAEPLFSVALGKLMLKDEPVSALTALTLLPIVLGGVLSSGGDASFSLSGLCFVSFSNVMFALRSVYTKQLKSAGYSGDAIQTFYEVSKFGTALLLALCIAVELAFNTLGVMEAYTLSANWRAISEGDSGTAVLKLLLTTGVTYAAYNQMSFLVLSMVTMLTHAVGNSCRRIATIVASVWFFGNTVTRQNALGIALVISGVILYSLSKNRDDEAAKQRNGKN